MARRSAEVLAKIVEVVNEDVARIRSENVGRRLDDKSARAIAEYLRAMAVADRNLSDAEKQGAQDAAGMTDEELDAEILRQAQEIRRKRANVGK